LTLDKKQRVEMERVIIDSMHEQDDTQNEIVSKALDFQESNWISQKVRDELDESLNYFKKIMIQWNKLPTEELGYVDINRPIPNTNEVLSFLNCKKCAEEFKAGKFPNKSPREIMHFEVGWTELGLQVWCVRHECNILHLDFQGKQLHGNTTRKGEKL